MNSDMWCALNACTSSEKLLFAIEPLDHGMYAWSQGGDTSLVNTQELRQLLQQQIGEQHGMGGDAVG